MKDDFQIIVKIDELEKFEDNSFKCPIYCQFGVKNFPDEYWDDFALIILEWWTEAARRLITQTSDREQFLFMDGPLEMDVRIEESGNCQVICINRMNKDRPTYIVGLKNLAGEVVKSAEKIIEKCTFEKWDSDDLTRLITSTKALNKALATN